MLTAQYNKRYNKSPIGGFMAGLAGLTLTGWIVWNWAPDHWWKEAIVIVIGFISVFLLTSWLLESKRWGTVISFLIFGFLILNRLEMLDILTGALLVAILGLISLIN